MKRPETELHLHLDGSLSLEVIKKLAEQTGYDFHGQQVRQLVIAGDHCNNLPEYLKCFELPGILLQTKEALTLAARELVKDLSSQGVIYSEIRFAPQLHEKQGLTKEEAVRAVIKGVEEGSKDTGLRAGVLLCAMVNGQDKENQETFELAKAFLGKGILGVDIAGPEGLVPMAHFEPLFLNAYKNNVPFTIHAGECGDYENILKAVSYGAKRIGHGCAAIQSEPCMDLLKMEKITLEMCVVSNLQTKAVSSIKKHPLKTFYDRGIRVTYNTDNMTVSDTTLEKEAELLKEEMGFTEADLLKMNRFALEGSFISEVEKENLIAFLDKNHYNVS